MADNSIVPGFEGNKEDSVKLRLEKANDNTIIVYAVGYIDTYNTQYFSNQMNRVIDSGFINLIVDCTGLNYMSSTGIGAFTALLKTTKPKGGDVALVGLQAKVFEVFQLLGFSSFFKIYPDHETAIAKLSGAADLEEVATFPKRFNCPICSKKLLAQKPGKFRCPQCKTALAIDEDAEVRLA